MNLTIKIPRGRDWKPMCVVLDFHTCNVVKNYLLLVHQIDILKRLGYQNQESESFSLLEIALATFLDFQF
jgi:hypothetical protein